MNNDTTTQPTEYAAIVRVTYECPDCGRENVDEPLILTFEGLHAMCFICGTEWIEG
jgi:hypothetical protein